MRSPRHDHPTGATPKRAAIVRRGVALFGAGALAVLSAACNSETSDQLDVGPTGNPALALTKPVSVGGAPVCASIGTESDARLPIYLTVTELALRPPGACGAYAQCGELALYVDGVLNNRSAVPAIDLLFRRLADRYHDGSVDAASGEADVLHVAILAVNEALEPWSDHDGKPLQAELDVVSFETCPPTN